MRMTRWAPWSALAGAAAMIVAPLGHRIGIAPPGFALLLVAAGLLVLVVSAVVLGVRMARGRGLRDGIACGALAGVSAAIIVPVATLMSARGAPAIHDITTDTGNPPAFVAVVPLNTPGRTDYAGPALAERQHAAYPDLRPALLPEEPAEAFERALATVRRMGWEVVAADPGARRIEATDRSFWFGFADDVVIRVTAAGETGSRVDVRSLSRVGVGDLGVNARRVAAFVAALSEE